MTIHDKTYIFYRNIEGEHDHARIDGPDAVAFDAASMEEAVKYAQQHTVVDFAANEWCESASSVVDCPPWMLKTVGGDKKRPGVDEYWVYTVEHHHYRIFVPVL
jgi:hypothetical protein